MPKLYVYFGLIILFYSNEHEPIHVHGKFEDRESKAELIFNRGNLSKVIYSTVKGKRPLKGAELKRFKELVEIKARDIRKKWIEFFIDNKAIKCENITRRLK